ncbi:hypothetical protein ACIA5A_26570 [Micromonospora sp. NPDC051300]|uniref:hypothetical protein n=1 Tax=Micromonospora sp. NPDC051300 TaxID=3364286 RepID=UPI00378C0B89
MTRRYNCRCGKKRYRDEPAALLAAATDQGSHGGLVSVYRCPGGSAWHLTAAGFVPEALRPLGRRLAHALIERGEIDLDAFVVEVLRGRVRPDPRRSRRMADCARQLTELGLTTTDPSGRRLSAVDRCGLARVVQIGLDGYAEERAGPPGHDE